ncbi:hypothetical protein K0M31_002239 [Melipona bicolor]|uniref:Uncharacterized protein n=1 Tax=Melipona bicolor TaxID=60889 RepID=A0AA40GH72_9HYME|nr:hypothetical protein K0M31_002239 [Melipona bicolor]
MKLDLAPCRGVDYLIAIMENLYVNLVEAITQGDVERGKDRNCLKAVSKMKIANQEDNWRTGKYHSSIEDKRFLAKVCKIKKRVGNELKGLRRIRQTQEGDVLLQFSPNISTEKFFCSVKDIFGEEFRSRLQPLAD